MGYVGGFGDFRCVGDLRGMGNVSGVGDFGGLGNKRVPGWILGGMGNFGGLGNEYHPGIQRRVGHQRGLGHKYSKC